MGDNLSNAFTYLLHSVITMYGLMFLLRLLLQLIRADYYNTVTQFVVALTDVLVKPLRRVIPPYKRLDLSCLLLFLILTAMAIMVQGLRIPPPGELLVQTFRLALFSIKSLYFVLIIAYVVLSWLAHSVRHPIIPLVSQLVDPVLQPFRRLIKPIGGLDLSPILALLALQFLSLLLGL